MSISESCWKLKWKINGRIGSLLPWRWADPVPAVQKTSEAPNVVASAWQALLVRLRLGQHAPQGAATRGRGKPAGHRRTQGRQCGRSDLAGTVSATLAGAGVAPDQRGHATAWRGRSQPTDAGCAASLGARLGAATRAGRGRLWHWPDARTLLAGPWRRRRRRRVRPASIPGAPFLPVCVSWERRRWGRERKKGKKWLGLGFDPLNLYDS